MSSKWIFNKNEIDKLLSKRGIFSECYINKNSDKVDTLQLYFYVEENNEIILFAEREVHTCKDGIIKNQSRENCDICKVLNN
jgi:hypothetical protein